ncbi:unnamed protein product [Effrenium voratum]|nr:unnamed protein product [Effrenium voratum]
MGSRSRVQGFPLTWKPTCSLREVAPRLLPERESGACWRQAEQLCLSCLGGLKGPAKLSDFGETSLSTWQDFKELWRRYDQDGNGVLDAEEFRFLLGDLMELQVGHRHVSEELFQVCLEDLHSHGKTVTFKDFQRYIGDFATIESVIQEHVPVAAGRGLMA